jgi:CheY-like chemotaxis protein
MFVKLLDIKITERQQTILVLEDKFLIHHGFMIAILKAEGYAVSETDCGADAVGIFIECYEDIDPALLDMQLSDMNGAEVLE